MDWWQDHFRRDDLLMRRRRIRRADRPPSEFDTLRGVQPKPIGTVAGMSISMARQGWRHVGWTDSGVKRRRSLFHVFGDSGSWAALSFAEYQLFGLSPDEFWPPLDADSDIELRLARALQDNWEDAGWDVAAYGPVLFIEDIWSERGTPSSVWRLALKELLDGRFSRCSGVLTLPFPLEYSGRCPEEMPSHVGFMRRQNAMFRLAEREFGATRMFGEMGEEGWMWRALGGEGLIPAPSLERTPERPHLVLVD